MVKLILILCAALLANANAGAVEEKLHDVYESIDGAIAGAITTAQKAVDAVREKSSQLSEDLVKAVGQQVDNVQQRVSGLFEQLGEKLDSLAGHSSSNAATCKEMTEGFSEKLHNVSAKATKCLQDKIPKAVSYIDNIGQISTEILGNLTETRVQAHSCVDNVSGFLQATNAVFCLNKAGAKAGWIALKRVPELTSVLAKFSLYVGTLSLSLSACTANSGLQDVISDGYELIRNVQQCVAQETEASGN